MCTSSGRGIEIRMNMKEKLYVVPEDINNASVDELNFWLSRFVVECRRDDGKPYPPNSLYNIMAGIQRFLRQKNLKFHSLTKQCYI